MAMGNELVNTGGPGMGIRVKTDQQLHEYCAKCALRRSRQKVKRWGFPSTL